LVHWPDGVCHSCVPKCPSHRAKMRPSKRGPLWFFCPFRTSNGYCPVLVNAGTGEIDGV
jgi:hypothetical protein